MTKPVKKQKQKPNETKPNKKPDKKPEKNKKGKKKIEVENEHNDLAGMTDLREYFKHRVEATVNSDSKFNLDFILAAPLKLKAEEEQICPTDIQTKHNGLQDSTAKGEH